MKRKKFSKQQFLEDLKKEIGKNEISKFCGRDYRRLICNNKIIIQNSNCKQHRKEQLSELWDNLAELQYYMYAKSSAQRIPEIRLRVHIICITEVLKFYQHYDFANSSTEKGESFFAWAKRVAKSFTDRKINSRTIMEILLRWHRVSHGDQKNSEVNYSLVWLR